MNSSKNIYKKSMQLYYPWKLKKKRKKKNSNHLLYIYIYICVRARATLPPLVKNYKRNDMKV